MSEVDSSKEYRAAFAKHKFNKILRDEVSKYALVNEPDNYHGLLAIMEDWTIIILCTAVVQYTRSNTYLGLFWRIVYVLTICIIGARQRGLARGLHEATYGCFVNKRYLNFVLAMLYFKVLLAARYLSCQKSSSISWHRLRS
ncbi:unnamed protein product [Adineta ricciae]|uniref:Uncharacterized protein n=1 Tax=Adineta ricciae TaxID=249248 RepID=A0A815G5Y1_ADIRI|nr:unnamed protein product [Adineta ricciae]CAF1413287.1 unnamed protein product [Adineta ricciae]